MSSPEIVRRTSALYRSVERLGQVVLSRSYEPSVDESETTNSDSKREGELSHAGESLCKLTELTIRSMCGAAVYSSGLAYYTERRISERHFSNDTISARLIARKSEMQPGGHEFFEPRLTLERAKNREGIKIFGECGCSWSKEGILCPHAAALMIAWVRNPEAFEPQAVPDERLSTVARFAKRRQEVMMSLRQLTNYIENGGSSQRDDLEILQSTYSIVSFWLKQVEDVDVKSFNPKSKNNIGSQSSYAGALRHEFCAVVNYVSLAAMTAIESKYPKTKASELYNASTTSTLGNVLKILVETMSEEETKDSTTKAKAGRQTKHVKKRGKIIAIRSDAKETKTSRSWDRLIEEFTSSTQ
ncbi:MAG: hypothetical protein JRN15_18975 [Nitrososphaerota archaeon]|nr:hypothetical protein [Nitrososphaerota archaeon]